jgi:hypothetical protein
MTLDELISNLCEVRNNVGGSAKVIVDSEDYVMTCNQITGIADEVNDRNAVVINVSK